MNIHIKKYHDWISMRHKTQNFKHDSNIPFSLYLIIFFGITHILPLIISVSNLVHAFGMPIKCLHSFGINRGINNVCTFTHIKKRIEIFYFNAVTQYDKECDDAIAGRRGNLKGNVEEYKRTYTCQSPQKQEKYIISLPNIMNSFFDRELSDIGSSLQYVKSIIQVINLLKVESNSIVDYMIRQKEFNNLTVLDNNQYPLCNICKKSNLFPPDKDRIYSIFDDGNNLQNLPKMSNSDLLKLKSSRENFLGLIQQLARKSLSLHIQNQIVPEYVFPQLSNQTLAEIQLCLFSRSTNNYGHEYGESVFGDDPINLLLYDLEYNVTNLLLASCAHNPDAPLLLNQWMPQLCTYQKYDSVRDRDFFFSWDDCHSSDKSELLKYYHGLGYATIPNRTDLSTLIELNNSNDVDDIKLAALESWMDDIHYQYLDNGLEDDIYFDENEFPVEKNVYDPNYNTDTHRNQQQIFMMEFQEFERDYVNNTQEFRDMYVKVKNYTHIKDPEREKCFCGHLVIACSQDDADLKIAENITLRMHHEFGKKVFVETRIFSHAQPEDYVFEIWFESYNIELLHSKRGARFHNNTWDGPEDVDKRQLEYLVEKVDEIITDNNKYKYDFHNFV